MNTRPVFVMLAGLFLACPVVAGDAADPPEAHTRSATAAPEAVPAAGSWRKARRSKPEPPVEVRFTTDGRDSRVTLQIASDVDHMGATLRLTVPGQGRPLLARLPAASAGEIQTVEWILDRPAEQPPRVSVEVDTGDGRLARSAVAPWGGTGKGRAGIGTAPRGRSAAAERTESGAAETEALVILPARETIRRKDD